MLGYAKLVRDRRWRRIVRMAVFLFPVFFGVLWGGFWWLSRNVAYATEAAATLSFAAFVSTMLVARAAWAPRLTSRRQLNVVVISWALLPALAVALISVARGVPVLAATGLGAAAGVITGVVYKRQRSQVTALQPVTVLSVDTLSEAQLVETATREPNEDPRIDAGQRAVQQLNHARALVFLAMRNGDFDRLIDALPLLRDVLHDQQLGPSVALIAARDLMDAQSLLVQHGGDADGYREAIELFAQLARENPNVPDAQPVLHEHRAGYQQCVLSAAIRDVEAATSDDDQVRADQARGRLRDAWFAVERELRTAGQLASDNAPIVPEFLIMLGAHLCTALDCVDEYRSDEGVELCRQALALRSGRSRHQRPRSELYLAECLVTRYEQRGDEGDLNEAEPLLHRLVRLGNPIEARARQLLLKISMLRSEASR
jgi:hypothetical protein